MLLVRKAVSAKIFLSSFPQIHRHQARLFHVRTSPGKYKTSKTKAGTRDQLYCTYQSPSRRQATSCSHPRSIQKTGLETRLQHKSKVCLSIRPGGRAGNRYHSNKAGLEIAGLSLNGLLEQWGRVWVETPGEATQGNSVLSVPSEPRHQN